MTIFRQPAVSGLFYPSEKKELEDQILSFLKKAKKEDWGKPKILIFPHEGIVYSGQTAAFDFKQVEGQDFKKVILLGVSHTSWFFYSAVYDLDFWVTPLGQVALNKDFIYFLTDGKYILKYKRSFIKEHFL